MRSADRPRQCLLFGADQTYRGHHETDAFDAVDGAHSEASECHRVVALKCTTLREPSGIKRVGFRDALIVCPKQQTFAGTLLLGQLLDF